MKRISILLILVLGAMVSYAQVETNHLKNGLTIQLFSNGTWSYKTKTGSFTDDRDGKTYKTVSIGTQIWMAENLAFKADSGCWAFGNDIVNVSKYGYLYTWNMARNSCPKGWHLPSDDEWTILVNYLGGEDVAGIKLKNITYWQVVDSIHSTNESGFTGLPGGYRVNNDGTFGKAGKDGIWWSGTDYNSENAWRHDLYFSDNKMYRWFSNKESGFSVRCIKD